MKKNAFSTAVLFALATLCLSAFAGEPQRDRKSDARASAEFIDAQNESTGKATLTETPNGVLVEVELEGLKPGWHAFHVHERGKCSAPDFKSAGEHYAPHGKKHGAKMKQGPHAGDMPNIHVGDDGKATFEVLLDRTSLGGGKASLQDKDGSALMVHEKADDYASQPSGNAGARVACAEIKAG